MKLIVCLLFVPLLGCAEMNPKFDCPMKPGIRCESLDKINSRIDSGEIAEETEKRENLQRVWIAPYKDSSGNYHSESSVFFKTV